MKAVPSTAVPWELPMVAGEGPVALTEQASACSGRERITDLDDRQLLGNRTRRLHHLIRIRHRRMQYPEAANNTATTINRINFLKTSPFFSTVLNLSRFQPPSLTAPQKP